MTLTPDTVRAARRAAVEAHAQLLGNDSACALAKSGQSYPAAKFWEGQTAALGELLRTTTNHLGAEAARLQDVWATRRIPGNEREAEAYRAGGLEALARFAEST
ncbi:MAG TPA: hypothetical protein GXZ30_15520 [Propionibacterium sp.]|jgi:hypothetical protein|nr:hypothetical protein [Propionibacterium sp.]